MGRWFTPSKGQATDDGARQLASRPPALAPFVPAPTPVDTKGLAAEEIARQKRMRAMAGGNTLLTNDAPTLSGDGGKSLLGS